LIVQQLQSGQQSEGLRVAVELQKIERDVGAGFAFSEPLLNCCFALMAEWGIAKVMRQTDGRKHGRDVPLDLERFMVRTKDYVGVFERQADSDAAGEVAHFVRMSQPCSNGIVDFHREHLSLVG
jgi:hypothetical protein